MTEPIDRTPMPNCGAPPYRVSVWAHGCGPNTHLAKKPVLTATWPVSPVYHGLRSVRHRHLDAGHGPKLGGEHAYRQSDCARIGEPCSRTANPGADHVW